MKIRLHNLAVASSLLSLVLCAQAGSDVIKIVTPDGRIVYTDQKPDKVPQGAKQTILKSFGEAGGHTAAAPTQEAGKPAKPAASANGVPVTNEEVAKANAEIKKKNDEEKAKVDAENCSVLKKNLAAYNIGRVMVAKPNGERAYLTDEEVVQAKARDEQAFKASCK